MFDEPKTIYSDDEVENLSDKEQEEKLTDSDRDIEEVCILRVSLIVSLNSFFVSDT